MIPFIGDSQGSQIPKVESRVVEWWLSGARKRGTEELLFNGQGVSVWEDKKSSGDGLW